MKAEFDFVTSSGHITGVVQFPEGFTEGDATDFIGYLLEEWELPGTELVGSVVYKEKTDE